MTMTGAEGGGEGGEEGGVTKIEADNENLVCVWGYLPGALPQKTPLQSPVLVKLPSSSGRWMDVCGGGCGFAMAISDSGKLITWGSTDDSGQAYVASGKHGEIPEPFPLPTESPIVKAAAGWAHCASVTDTGEVYAWGWRECIPSGKVLGDSPTGGTSENDVNEQASPHSQGSKGIGGSGSSFDCKGPGEENTKRRKVSSAKQAAESSMSGEENLSALPCLVTFGPGVRILSVAAGGRHTLALSDVGQVWGWGYGGEGQLGLGTRIRMVSSPHQVPCIESSSHKKDRTAETQGFRVPGNYIKEIACGGRHSAVITVKSSFIIDAGALLMFGWGLYGQFGQLGTGSSEAETIPRLLEAPSLENVHARVVSCGARHSAIVADDGRVFCWGWNKYGQLGLGDVIDRSVPCQVTVEGLVSKRVACGWWHTLLLAESTSS